MGECTQLLWSEQQQLNEKGFVVRKRWDGVACKGEAVRIWVRPGTPLFLLPPQIQRILTQPEEK